MKKITSMMLAFLLVFSIVFIDAAPNGRDDDIPKILSQEIFQ